MIDNVNEFLGTVAESELAQAARRSARMIWNAIAPRSRRRASKPAR